jgi:hypothetical protein
VSFGHYWVFSYERILYLSRRLRSFCLNISCNLCYGCWDWPYPSCFLLRLKYFFCWCCFCCFCCCGRFWHWVIFRFWREGNRCVIYRDLLCIAQLFFVAGFSACFEVLFRELISLSDFFSIFDKVSHCSNMIPSPKKLHLAMWGD